LTYINGNALVSLGRWLMPWRLGALKHLQICGVERSLPRDLENSRNAEVITAQTV
jgi:hypothetical protein